MRYVTLPIVLLAALLAPAAAHAQVEIGAGLATTSLGEFDASDTQIAVRVGWHPLPLVGLEAEFNVSPADFPEPRAFSGGRTAGLFGVTIGPQVGPVRVFARIRPGFFRFAEAPEPFPCIAIFPPPLSCALGAGDTLTAFDLGGGLGVSLPVGLQVRVDAGTLLLRYPGPVLTADRTAHEDGFFSGNLRLGLSAGWRF